ncbi:MAG: Ribosomal protein L11 methyltransferase (EC [uncultured Thiotrichaceae bacterium]|uniref:Ribosomal protein L11 methyltransferase n=1 Tax=uncultured Thiotrichaceae bacterium TaxID=298394 RepID=A0A6S6S2A1_9GAMM|nr:MAG: Ribosomal protein L11 methyltransferase (EC [uncultured Thiotrichaceae bacterium]
MPWKQLKCHTTKSIVDDISHLLEEKHGCLSVTYQDAEDKPVLEPLPGETPLWDEIILTALFEEDVNINAIVSDIKKANLACSNISIEDLADQTWERSWMENYHPMQFGKSLWIYPSNHQVPDNTDTKILLDPGLAFGTGTHPTTALCLEWLDANPPKNLTAIDYGCGSGVLAIAAVKLGATSIVATDIDEQALIATQSNVKANDIPAETIFTSFPEAMDRTPVDLMIANILSGPLTELALEFAALTKPQGYLVLSGILHNQEDNILSSYEPFYENLQISRKDDWSCVQGVRRTQ